MKFLYVFLLALLTSSVALCQTPSYVVVKGTITNSNGAAVSNWPVYIMTDSSNSPVACNQYHTKYTNANGYYIDTLACSSGVINAVTVYTQNCNGSYLTYYLTVPSSPRVVEKNITLCVAGTATCHAAFTTSVSGNVVGLNASTSTASTGSTVSQYKWNFGDGTSLVTTNPVASHSYTSSGVYYITLFIGTNGQCYDSTVKAVTITTNPVSCQAYFIDSIIGSSVYFNSIYSTTGTGDSIIARHWTFGDGASLGGNVVSPSHTYTASGTYSACLTIISARGCQDSICKSFTIANTATCVSYFLYTRQGTTTTFAFNSSSSSTPAPDVIVRRRWEFGDGDTLGGNVISPTHTYAHAGTYSVCLKIFTQNGCDKSLCKTINFVDSSCHAAFSFANTTGSLLTMFTNTSTSGNSSGSMQYSWSFGDSTYSSVANPTHQYTSPGTYYVCLTIYTSTGCQSTICQTVVVQGTSACHALFSYATTSSPNIFNFFSASSSGAGTTITSYYWSFGDSTFSTIANPVHQYPSAGVYHACLTIGTSSGCQSTVCETITVQISQTCHAVINPATISTSTAGAPFSMTTTGSTTAPGDSIIQRYWIFGDGSTLGGNNAVVTHIYNTAGTYHIYMIMTTASGCRDTADKTLTVVANPGACHAQFADSVAGSKVYFYSGASTTVSGDSIRERGWSFGDYNNPVHTLGGNVINPVHTYTYSGTFKVCLTIVTVGGCRDSICKNVVITIPVAACAARFTFTRPTPGKVLFNSTASSSAVSDSIVQRKWNFGDGTTLTGNMVSPLKSYPTGGTYYTCLKITTAKGCISELCQSVTVSDSTGPVSDTSRKVEIISLYPNPSVSTFSAVIWSKYSGVAAQLAIVDVYGVTKWTVSRTLVAGNNTALVPVSLLSAGPYIFKVTTIYGVRSKPFYKL